MAMDIFVENESKHAFKCIESWGTSLESFAGTIIPAGQKVRIGTIDIPRFPGNGNWGWWYVQDDVNQATFEFFAFVAPESHHRDYASAGLRANNSHNKDRKEGATPNRLPRYLDTRRDDSSFTLIVKADWTANPPDYIFNFGHYTFRSAPVIGEIAAHAYVKAVRFNGVRKEDDDGVVRFKCYGGTDDTNNNVYPALSFVASEAQLRLARTICCFDPDDVRTDYGRKPIHSPEGKLHLGDCCGIIYLHSGVCHQMANRICAAVTDFDVGDLADMSIYNDTALIWNAYGEPPPPKGPKAAWDTVYPLYSSEVALTDEQLQRLGVFPGASSAVNLLFRPWEEYLAACKKLAAQAGK